MTTREAFEKWFDERFQNLNTDTVISHEFEKAKSNMRYGYEAAKAECEKEIAELKDKHINQLAGVSTAALGYFKDGDSIYPDYDTVSLRDVTNLYAKYDALFKQCAELEAEVTKKESNYQKAIKGRMDFRNSFREATIALKVANAMWKQCIDKISSLTAEHKKEIAELQSHNTVLRVTLEEIADGMNTKAINNEVIKSSTLERFAGEIKQALAANLITNNG